MIYKFGNDNKENYCPDWLANHMLARGQHSEKAEEGKRQLPRFLRLVTNSPQHLELLSLILFFLFLRIADRVLFRYLRRYLFHNVYSSNKHRHRRPGTHPPKYPRPKNPPLDICRRQRRRRKDNHIMLSRHPTRPRPPLCPLNLYRSSAQPL